MKNILYCCALCTIILAACKKDNAPQASDNQKKLIRINVSGFSQSIDAFDDARLSNDYINHLYYYIFKNNTNHDFVNFQVQHSTDSSFGTFLDSLDNGDYIIAVLGTKEEIYIGPQYGLNEQQVAYLTLPGCDVFYQKQIVSVIDSANASFTLDRQVSRLRITIKDPIPLQVKKLNIWPNSYPLPSVPDYGQLPATIVMDMGRHLGDYRIGYYPSHTWPVPDSAHNKGGFTIEMYLLTLTPINMSVIITALDNADHTVLEKSLLQVQLEKNKKTILQGNLFTDIPTEGKTITVTLTNTNWNNDSTVVNF